MDVADGPERGNVYFQDEAQIAAVQEYWTPERRAAAQPVDGPEISAEELDALRREEGDGARPSSLRNLPSGEAAPAQLRDAYSVDVNKRPYWNAGKWFFTTDSGVDMVGSAAFVGSKRMLMTAAHCVRNASTGEFYHNFLFVRAGRGHWWGWSGQDVHVDWIGCWYMWVGQNFRYDYSFCRTTSDSGTGWLGLTAGCPYPSFTALGYPTNYDKGNSMHAADGTRGEILDVGVVQMKNNPMGEGSSGGPWVGALSHDGGGDKNIACGLNSVKLQGQDDIMYGPFFDDDTLRLWSCVESGGDC